MSSLAACQLHVLAFFNSHLTCVGELHKFMFIPSFLFWRQLFAGIVVDVLFYFQMIPMSVLYGVFLFMGVSSMVGVQLIQRILIIFMPPKYQPDYMFLRTVPLRRVHMFTAVQVACLAVLWVIKTIKSISIVFPIMVGDTMRCSSRATFE